MTKLTASVSKIRKNFLLNFDSVNILYHLFELIIYDLSLYINIYISVY